VDDCRAYVETHPELQRPMYRVPHTPGVVGEAANFVIHIAGLMEKRT